MKNPILVFHVAIMAAAVMLCGCSKGPEAPGAEPAEAQTAEPKTGVKLAAEQVAMIGLQTAALSSVPLDQVTTGQATVLSHDALAQSLAEVRAATAVSAQSEAALKRLQDLQATPGAMGLDAVEIARRQASVDAAQLQLAQRRQMAQFGDGVRGAPQTVMEALGDGRKKLVRLVFPQDVPELPQASDVSLAATEDPSAARRWKVESLWAAPSEGGIPGRSLFAVINDGRLSEGRRMLALYSRRTQDTGVLIPAAAVITQDGQYWCYVQTGEGEFERIRIDTDHPVTDGYAVAGKLKAGERVVTRGAGILLARELGSSEGEG